LKTSEKEYQVMPRTKKNPEPAPVTLPPAPTNGPPCDVFTLEEAAAYLRLLESDVLRLVREQGLPARQLGLEWRFLKTAIQQWLSTGSPRPQSGKEALLALAGKYKDDPDLMNICEEAYRRRGRPMTEDE
jgi:excisionase family DNA binding protein